MITILRKEINLFFSSLIGYLVIAVFLVINGIFLWLLPNSNILSEGYATLEQLFTIAPWVLMFLVPALTMRSFAEEQKTGTFEILATKPISDTQIVLGKFFAGVSLVFLSILPTLVYFYTVYQLANPVGNVDVGATIGSYIGLLFIGAVYVSIGVFASSLTDNQIVAFILSMLACFFFYGVADWIVGLQTLRPVESLITYIGLQTHYNSISRGVIDTRDLVYFIGFIALFIIFTKTRIAYRKW
ncbi:gliding motility-associated ABC transporter permease subunit GldF [bacterium]|nr:gliding motility-associated ABC transporter permease subunit GldF [bacterium]